MSSFRERCLWNGRIFYALLWREFLIFKSSLKRRLINTFIWTFFLIYVFEFIGLSSSTGYGLFAGCGECATQGFYRIFGLAIGLISDIEGPRKISYYLTLPVSQRLVFLSYAISASIRVIIMSLPILFITKLVVGSGFDLAHVSLLKLVAIFLCIHFFYGSLYLMYVAFTHSLEALRNVRTRFADTLFWTGGFYFTWARVYATSPIGAYLDLCNPLIYANEGMRAAVMGQDGYLPFWLCCVALLGFTLFCLIISIRTLMKKLDCVF